MTEKSPLQIAFRRAVRDRLDELGHTQRWLAEVLGVTPQCVSRVLTKDTPPPGRQIEKYAKALGGLEFKVSLFVDHGTPCVDAEETAH